MRVPVVAGVLIMMWVIASGCQSMPPIDTVPSVDIERFMGDWYVMANIPTFLEKDAFNALESYRLDDDGTIDVMFTFNKGAFDGPLKKYTPRAFIQDASNAVWGMQFLWPFKAEYRIVYLEPDYGITIIGRTKRDYVWVMARKPAIEHDDFQLLLTHLKTLGYDIDKLRRVPHQYP